MRQERTLGRRQKTDAPKVAYESEPGKPLLQF